MSTVPPTNSFNFAENSAQNEAALEELTSAIVFGQGADTITLLLVRCNYNRLRDQMVEQLGQQLAGEELQGPVQVLRLGTDDTNLYAQLQTMRGVQPGPAQPQTMPSDNVQPGAALVLGMERLCSLETFLVELNKRREEFRREFPFPLVLWFTDEGYRQLSQYANDFESIAGGETIAFSLSPETLTDGLQQANGRLFTTLLEPNTPESFNRLLKQVDFGYLQSDELSLALAELQRQKVALGPDLQAGVTFAQGLNLLNQEAIGLFEQSAHYWRTQAADQLKYGLALFYLGRARYYAVDSVKYQSADWESALPPLQDCVAVFEQAERPDLVCKCINALERVLHRLERWDELETVAQQAVDLRQRYPKPDKQAENYGFLADVAMRRGQWHRGAELAQLALDTLAQRDSWWRMLYLARLAEANYQLGDGEGAIVHLQAAQAMGVLGHPRLYTNILGQLQARLREQHRYLDAFEIKQERLAVEKQYGLRAFIGAGRLRSQRTEQRVTVRSERETLEEIAPEIEASGRKRDLTALLQRIAGTSHKLLVVHGTSGVGKSSLINGGLLPALRGRSLENRRNVPVLVRKYTDWRRALGKSLAAALGESASAVVRRQGKDLLREVLEGDIGEEAPKIGGPQTPNFGGFEVDSPQDWGARGAAEGDDLAETLPNQQSADLNRNILDALRVCEESTLRPVLLLDQFEEFFFANPDPLKRREFFGFVADCLDLPGALKIVFSIREDYLHYLLEARQLVRRNQLESGSMARAQLEDILGKQILYEIGNFSPADTKAIIENLASGARMYLEPGLVDALVDDLAGALGEVRPIEMQVVGAQLQTETIQTLARYRELGEQPKETLVQNYLNNVVDDCGDENRQLAGLVLFLLTDERRTRPLKTRPELMRELEALGIRGVAGEADKETDGLDLVLRILTGSGIVVYLPDRPDDRYQLVHDYLAGVIRDQQAPRLEQLMVELEEEKRQRVRLEGEKADLEVANAAARGELALIEDEREDLRARNRQARRGLAGTIAVAAAVAVVTVGVAIAATKNADKSTLAAGLITWKAKRQEIWADLKQRKASFDVEVAEFRQDVAGKKAQSAADEVKVAEALVEDANTRLKEIGQQAKQAQETAQKAVAHAQSQLATARDDRQQAQSGLEQANIARENARQEQKVARAEATIAREGTKLEIAGVRSLKTFEHDQGKALLASLKTGQRLQNLVNANNIRTLEKYPAASPTATLQTILNRLREKHRLEGHQNEVLSAVFSNDGQRVVTASSDTTARVWDLRTGESTVLEGHQNLVRSAVFSNDGQRVVTASDDTTARVWDLRTGESTVLEGHQNLVLSAVFSNDGQRVVTASSDNTARVWDLQGRELNVFDDHTETVFTARFSADGQRVLTASADDTARIWRADTLQALLIRACNQMNVYLVNNPDVLKDLPVCHTPQRLGSASRMLVQVGDRLAGRNDPDTAIEKYQLANDWSPGLVTNPVQRANGLQNSDHRR
ncbi:nSTAND1 domain-containing NTPase [Leptothoe spongobia]|uniref:AAA family ATPase n=1 Tax=Leptothoe spongobia TAU-MAC 1115 TaxID=1967444 RepID=A0A947DDQ6_9CYAN|nr:AAA family ATPase [Leptothoe spongobia]MBT9315030.1 AAA family ATPase [Leptothoe spongobia TAU-MAC 1115]